MTERTINEEELKAALADKEGMNNTLFYTVMDAAFPPIFKPKEGEAIWSSFFDMQYELRVFSYMDNGEYVCFEDSDEDKMFAYQYAKPQTPTQKGE
ncbi:MAG: hypothetical protein ACI9N9_002363 [Enterobacterales bacterium]|jgi:hypothetical protein